METISLMPSQHYSFYKIYCNDSSVTACYIGKTSNFTARCANHKSNCKNMNTLKLYCFIREHGDWENWTIHVIHRAYCTLETAGLIEYALIKQHDANLNIQIPCAYKLQDYNKRKCREHYKITRDCDCGWSGSKMDWSHHIKSKRHKKYLIELFEENLELPYQEDNSCGIQNNTNAVTIYAYGCAPIHDN